jgi:zinc transporter ZupT
VRRLGRNWPAAAPDTIIVAVGAAVAGLMLFLMLLEILPRLRRLIFGR